MSFSARQLHCLGAMGLVAWTSKSDSASEFLPQTQALPISTALQPGSSSTDVQAVSESMPATIEEQRQWLVRQPLTQLTYKGRQTSCIGAEQGALMVVCLQVEAPVQLPLSRECTELFNLMMRAIDMPRTGFRQCAISTGPVVQIQDSATTLYLDDILAPYTKAVLVLDPLLNAQSDASESNKALLPQSSIPLWRVPHPDLLLTTPAFKRRAWEGLKSLKQGLDDQR